MGIGIAAGIGAVGSLVSNALSNNANKREARRQRQWLEQMWAQKNEYNSPEAQMARLKEAGLNPNLIYGSGVSGATGLADSVGKYDRAEITYDNPIAVGVSTAHQVGRIANLDAQNAVLRADVPLKNASALATLQQAAKTGVDKQLVEKTMNGQVDAIRLDNDLRKQRIVGQEIDNYIKDASKANLIKKDANAVMLQMETLRNTKAGTQGKYLENALKAYDLRLQRTYGIPASNSGLIINLIRSALGIGTRAYDLGKEHNISPSLIR